MTSKKAARTKTKTKTKGSVRRGSITRVAVLMGSKSDWESMKPAVEVLEGMGVGCDARVISAHRTPDRHAAYVSGAEAQGIELFICGAGFAELR